MTLPVVVASQTEAPEAPETAPVVAPVIATPPAPAEPSTTPVAVPPAAPAVVPVDDPPVGDPAKPQKGTTLTDPAVLQSELDKARQQAAQSRHRATAAEAALAAVQQTLQNPDGPTPTPPGPEPAGEATLQQLQKQLADANMANALWRVAPQAGADAALLVPYLRGSGQLDTLNASDPAGLDAALLTMAQAALVLHPQLKAIGVTVPPSALGDPPAGPTLARTFTRAEIKAFTPEQYDDTALQAQVDEWLRAGAPE